MRRKGGNAPKREGRGLSETALTLNFHLCPSHDLAFIVKIRYQITHIYTMIVERHQIIIRHPSYQVTERSSENTYHVMSPTAT